MSVDVLRAARFIAVRAGWSRTNLELQKLIYIAHMIHVGVHEAPLVDGHFEAWELGPVHPTLYHHVKKFGASPVARIQCSDEPIEGTERSLMETTYDALVSKSSTELVAITHWEGGAWARNYVAGERHRIIPQKDILDEYRARQRA